MTTVEQRASAFGELPIKRAVIKQIVPAIAGQMVVLIYNLADTYFVGMLNDPAQTASVTVAGPALLMLTALSNLFGIGGASLMAQSLGRKNPELAARVSTVAFYGGLLLSLLFSLAVLFFAKPLLYLCGATDSTYPHVLSYVKWVIMIGGPFTVLNTLLANLVRAEGGASSAFIGVSLGGAINIALDPFFVLPQFLGFGVGGAGLATAISNMAATAYYVIYLAVKRRSTIISLDPRNLKSGIKEVGTVLSLGFPSAMQYILTVVAVAAQSRFVSMYGTEAVAALGIVKKLDQLPIFFALGVANGLLPLLAYNHAAGKHERRRSAFRFGCTIAVSFAVLCLIAYEIFAPTLAGLFIDDPLTTEYGATFLRIMVTAMPLMAISYPLIVQFQAIGRVCESLICSLLRKGVLDIPMLFIMNAVWPLYGCMLVQPIVDGISLTAAMLFNRRIRAQGNG